MAIRRIALTLLIWGYFLSVFAQDLPGTSKTLTVANGLPNSTVTGMIQDRAGFIWISTADGLARYDGHSLKIFRNRPGDTTSLADNKIIQLEETSKERFLIGMESGNFQLFDPVTERFTSLLNERFLAAKKATVTLCHLSADGRQVWGLMPGVRLIHYDRSLKTVAVFDLLSLVGETNVMIDFILTAKGDLYGISTKGLLQLNTGTGQKRFIPLPFKLHYSGFSSGGHEVVETANGEIALFGYKNVALYNPVTNRFRTVPLPSPIEKGLIYYALKTLSDNHLYLGYMNRLYRLEANDQLKLLADTPVHDRKNALLLDRSGVLWGNAPSGGLIRRDLRPLPFTFHPNQKSFLEDLIEHELGVPVPKDLTVWQSAWWPRYTTAPNQAAYLIDPSRVYRYHPKKQKIEEIESLRTTNKDICCKLGLKVTPTGRVWVYANTQGLIETDADGGHKRLYPNSRLPLKGPYPGYDATDIQPMGTSVWVASTLGLGLFQYDSGKQRFVRQLRNEPNNPNSLPYNTLTCLKPDPFDPTLLWIGTAGGGLCQLNTTTLTVRRLGEAEGFPNGNIQSIEADRRGFLWCSTNRGLIRVNPKTWRWRHFTTSDGLYENEFSHTSSAALPDGRLVFGSPAGRTIFDPLAIRDDSYEPATVLTSLKINNSPVEANVIDSPIPAPINALSELELTHTQNFLTFEFAGLQYTKPENLHYRYFLTNVDPGWVNAGKQHTANYTQLAPGHYMFNVNSTNTDGKWSRHIKRLAVHIQPPVWATWWAYAVYLLIFGGLLYGFIRFRIRRIREQHVQALRRRESEQLKAVDELKTRFFSNITHEFRTPLSLILSPIEKLLQEPKHDALTRQTLTSVQRNADQLLRLINQLLDLSKLEAGGMAVSLARGSAVDYIGQIVESFRPLAEQKGVTLIFQTETVLEEKAFDADKWLKITTNLLSNALKFTRKSDQVLVELITGSPDLITLTIADTGIGIPADKLPHIFDRFYQADDSRTRAYEGTGIGLALVKELIDVLGGTIAVESQPEEGTTFRVQLPVFPALVSADVPTVVLPIHPKNELTYVHSRSELSQANTPGNLPLILIVEDNTELRNFIADELAGSYRTLAAANGQEGWRMAQTELPDVVISDIMMPGMDGYELTRHLKASSVTNHIAVMLLTARASHESRMEGLTQGADDYLTKPFHVDELHQRLYNLLTHQQALRVHYEQQFSQPDAVFRPEALEDDFLRQLHAAIDDHLDDSTFGVEELARKVGMSRRTLNRKLAAVANQSANDILRQHRLKRAAQLLRQGRNASETAYLVGYESPAHFSLIFKEFFQKTPIEYSHS